MRIKIVFLTGILIFLQAQTLLADMEEIRGRGVIRHLAVPYARFVMGPDDGFSVALVKGFARELGLGYEYVEIVWPRAIRDLTGKEFQLEKGRVNVTGTCPVKGDVIANGMTILPWRKELLDFSAPTFPTGIWLIAQAGSRLTPIQPGGSLVSDIQTVKSLVKGVSVLSLPGSCLDPALYGFEDSGAKWVVPQCRMSEFAPAVINQDAECSLMDIPDAMIAMEKWPRQLKIIGPVSAFQEMGCGFRKSDPDLRRLFDQYLKRIQENGAYMKLVRYYYPGITAYFPDFFKCCTWK